MEGKDPGDPPSVLEAPQPTSTDKKTTEEETPALVTNANSLPTALAPLKEPPRARTPPLEKPTAETAQEEAPPPPPGSSPSDQAPQPSLPGVEQPPPHLPPAPFAEALPLVTEGDFSTTCIAEAVQVQHIAFARTPSLLSRWIFLNDLPSVQFSGRYGKQGA